MGQIIDPLLARARAHGKTHLLDLLDTLRFKALGQGGQGGQGGQASQGLHACARGPISRRT